MKNFVNFETEKVIDTSHVKHKKFTAKVVCSFRKDSILKPWKVTIGYKDGSEVQHEFTQECKAKIAYKLCLKLMDCTEDIECVGYKPGKLAAYNGIP